MNNKKINITNIIVVGTVIWVMLLIRAFFGQAAGDEGYYISEMKRMYQGDMFFVDDWSTGQGLFIFCQPLYAIRRMLGATDDGVILYFRIIFMIVQYIAFVVSCILCKKISLKTSKAIYIIPFFSLFFVPWQISAISYNSISFLIVEILFLSLCFGTNVGILGVCCLAFLFSILVIAEPFLFTLYIFWICTAFAWAIKNKNRKIISKTLVFTIVGAIVAVSLVVIPSVYAGFKTLIYSISCILNDPEHSVSFLGKVKSFFYTFFYFDPVASVLMLGLLVVAIINRKIKKQIINILVVFLAFLLVCWDLYNTFFILAWTAQTMNIMLALFGIVIMAVKKSVTKEEIWRSAILFLYSFGILMASNTGVQSVAWSIALFVAYSMTFVPVVMKENFGDTNLAKALSLAYILLILVITLAARFIMVWVDDKVWNLNVRITEGPLAGIVTSEKNAIEYYEDYDYFINNLSDENNLLYLTYNRYINLYCDTVNSNALSCFFEYDLEKENKYLNVHREKWPDVIYVGVDDKDILNELSRYEWAREAEVLIKNN